MKKKTARSTKSKKSSHLDSNRQFDTKRLNTVTSVSKVLAAVLFVALPFLAFVLGMYYQGNFGILQY